MSEHGWATRRDILRAGLALGVTAILDPLAAAWQQQQQRSITPNMMMGPFYPLLKPLDKDADLTLIAGHKERAKGQLLHVTGRVLNRNGDAVHGAKLQVWQANAAGRYNHPSDPNRAPLDPNFQGYGELLTDSDGRFHFKTVKPGAYPLLDGTGMRSPHIHFDIFGRSDRKVTQMFFAGEPMNEQDFLYRQIRENKEGVLGKVVKDPAGLEPGAWLVEWNVILPTG